MKKIILIILIFNLFYYSPAQASEIFGKISTNPKNIPIPSSVPPTVPATAQQSNPVLGSQAAVGLFQKPQEKIKNPETDIKVLGIKYYPDYTLLRGLDKKIYIIEGQTKKRILDLRELQKYKGKKIFDVSYEDLTVYQTRPFLNGELIRVKNTPQIYVIELSAKKRIYSLTELRLRFREKVIHDVSIEEFRLYPDDK